MNAVIGIGLIFGGYAIGLWAYCLIRGYCVSLFDILNPRFPSAMSQAAAASQRASANAAASASG